MGHSIRCGSGAPVLSSNAANPCGAGTFTISVSLGTLAAANYTFQFSSGVLTVKKAILTVTAANSAMVYGGTIPKFSYSTAGFVYSDTAATSLTGTFSLVSNGNATAVPGNYVITPGPGSVTSANYSFAFVAGVFTITKALLSVTPMNLSMAYGAQLPFLAYTITGFVNGDGGSVVQGAPLFVTQAASTSPVGSYSITGSQGTLTSLRYLFQILSGKLTVTRAILTVTARSFSMVYGASLPEFTFAYSGFKNSDSAAVVSGAPLLTSTVTARSPVGTYPIAVGVASLTAANYSFNPVNGLIAVTKAPLTVLPVNQTMTYGGKFPSLTYSLLGFVNGDSQATATTGSPVITTTAEPNSPVASYAINSAPGSLAAGNYSFQCKSGTFLITRATLTLTANSLSMTVGSPLPALTFSASGFVNGDSTASSITGSPALTTNATATSKVGTYTIAIAQGSAKATNYTFAFVNGTLTIFPKSGSLKRPLRPFKPLQPLKPLPSIER